MARSASFFVQIGGFWTRSTSYRAGIWENASFTLPPVPHFGALLHAIALALAFATGTPADVDFIGLAVSSGLPPIRS